MFNIHKIFTFKANSTLANVQYSQNIQAQSKIYLVTRTNRKHIKLKDLKGWFAGHRGKLFFYNKSC